MKLLSKRPCTLLSNRACCCGLRVGALPEDCEHAVEAGPAAEALTAARRCIDELSHARARISSQPQLRRLSAAHPGSAGSTPRAGTPGAGLGASSSFAGWADSGASAALMRRGSGLQPPPGSAPGPNHPGVNRGMNPGMNPSLMSMPGHRAVGLSALSGTFYPGASIQGSDAMGDATAHLGGLSPQGSTMLNAASAPYSPTRFHHVGGNGAPQRGSMLHPGGSSGRGGGFEQADSALTHGSMLRPGATSGGVGSERGDSGLAVLQQRMDSCHSAHGGMLPSAGSSGGGGFERWDSGLAALQQRMDSGQALHGSMLRPGASSSDGGSDRADSGLAALQQRTGSGHSAHGMLRPGGNSGAGGSDWGDPGLAELQQRADSSQAAQQRALQEHLLARLPPGTLQQQWQQQAGPHAGASPPSSGYQTSKTPGPALLGTLAMQPPPGMLGAHGPGNLDATADRPTTMRACSGPEGPAQGRPNVRGNTGGAPCGSGAGGGGGDEAGSAGSPAESPEGVVPAALHAVNVVAGTLMTKPLDSPHVIEAVQVRNGKCVLGKK